MDTQIKTKTAAIFMHKHLRASVITIVSFVSLIVLTLCIFWYTMTYALENYLSQQTEVLGSSLATQAAFNATQSILTNDLLSLNVLLNRLVVDENILSARVYNKKDELLAEASSTSTGISSDRDFRPNDDRRLVYSSSIRFRDEIVGHVLITLDRTPAQNTLQHLNNLLIGMAIFIATISVLLIMLITKWLFTPINEATTMLNSFSKGRKSKLDYTPIYREARELHLAVKSIYELELPKKVTPQPVTTEQEVSKTSETQFEINFDAIFEESRQRSCVLYFDVLNLQTWQEKMSPLQVANLLTPIYRAIFQASEIYLGQVHQYKENSVIILFSAKDCDDNLYMNAVSTAQLFLGLIDKLFENTLYSDIPKLNFHLGLHQGNSEVTNLMKNDQFEAEKIQDLLVNVHQLSLTQSINKLIISDEIFTLPHIQNRVFTGLPEIIEHQDAEILAYEVKGLSGKYKLQIQEHIEKMTSSEPDKVNL